MRIRLLLSVAAIFISGIFGMVKLAEQPVHSTRIVEAQIKYSHQTSEGWDTRYIDETGHKWDYIHDERPELRSMYILCIDDNGTPDDFSDDIPEIK